MSTLWQHRCAVLEFRKSMEPHELNSETDLGTQNLFSTLQFLFSLPLKSHEE